jgi:hypothetical protein
MNTKPKQHCNGDHLPSAAHSRRLAIAILALTIIGPRIASAQLPPRFYLKSLAGANAVPLVFDSMSGNSNPMDPSHVVSADAKIDSSVLLVGYAKLLPLFDRTLTLAVVEPMGRISSSSTVFGHTSPEAATGFGDPTLEVDYNLIGPKAIRSIPDMLRYEPKFSLDVLADVAFPIGEYDSSQPLNLGQNRWYGRVGAPITLQLGPWVPGRRTTLELLPCVWFFSDNNDFNGGQTLSTDPVFHLEGHLTRDLTEHFWASLDAMYYAGGKSSINAASIPALSGVAVGFTVGYEINDNISLTAGYMATVNDSAPTDMQLDGFRLSLTYGWHKIVEGQKRLKSE